MTSVFSAEGANFAQFFDDYETMSDEEWELELDAAFEQATSLPRTLRGTGYCENVGCGMYAKGTFLLLHEGPFVCQQCGETGLLVPERGIPLRNSGEAFAEVRVEYSYDPSRKEFREIAILRDDSWTEAHGIYIFQSPLITTDKRAFKVAEALLCTLNEQVLSDTELANPPKTHERILSFDSPLQEFRQELAHLEQLLQNNRFLKEPVVPRLREEESSLQEGEHNGSQSQPHLRASDSKP